MVFRFIITYSTRIKDKMMGLPSLDVFRHLCCPHYDLGVPLSLPLHPPLSFYHRLPFHHTTPLCPIIANIPQISMGHPSYIENNPSLINYQGCLIDQEILQILEMFLGQDIPRKKMLAILYCTTYFLMCFKFSKYKKTEFQTMSWV